MPISKAKRLCPNAIFLRGNFERYRQAHQQIFKIIDNYTPDVEVTSIDEAYLDMTGFERLYGHPLATADRMKREVQDKVDLSASIGIASNKIIAKIASDCAKPNGILMVLHGFEAEFLAPLEIGRLPGIGKHTHRKMIDLGIRRIGQLARIDEETLVKTFGQWGYYLHQHAGGAGTSTIEPPSAPKSISRENTFEEDTIDQELIASTLFHLVEKTAATLRREEIQARTITLKLRYSDFKTLTRSTTLNEPTDIDKVIYEAIIALFQKAYTRRARVRLVGVGLSNFTSNQWQQELFDFHKKQKMKNLYRSIDALRNRYGFDSIKILKHPPREKKKP